MGYSKVFGEIKRLAWLDLNGKSVLIVTDNYDGEPIIYCKYDVLICSKKIFSKYKNFLIPKNVQNLDLQVKLIK